MPRAKQQAKGAVAAWLKDPAFDLGLIVGITLLALGMGTATAIDPRLFIPLLTVHVWLFGFDHVIATLTKLVGLPEDRQRNRFLILYLPPLILAVNVAIGARLGLWALNTVYFFWQAYHSTRQSWGLAQRYRHQAGGLPWDPPRLSELTLWSVPIWGLLYRCHQHPAQFLYMDLWMPRVPLWLVQAAGGVSGSLLSIWVVTRLRAFWRGELALGHTLFLLAHFTVFFTGYLVLDNLNSGWLLVNVWHNAQYLGFVWLHNRQRFATGVRAEARWLSWLCQPGYLRAAAYYLACLAISSPFYFVLYSVGDRIDEWLGGAVISVSLVASMTLNFHHYVVDSVIWKRRHSPALS